jgi:hypothetical protein
MTTAAPSAALATIQPFCADAERIALAGFLAGYRGLTRGAYALDRHELGALLVAAGLGPPGGRALISLLALNGLRVSEATGAGIEHLGLERGHRTLTVTRKGGKVVTVPLAPRTARAIDLAIGERTEGPVFLPGTGGGWTGTAPGGSSARPPAAPEPASRSRPTRCDTPHHRCTMPECRCAMSRRQPRMRTRGPRCGPPKRARGSLDRHATTLPIRIWPICVHPQAAR